MDRQVEDAAARVLRMEQHFDALQSAVRRGGEAVHAGMLCSVQALTQYMESGEWLRDYELDEQGVFEPDMKRGVLAQDALHDLLAQADAWIEGAQEAERSAEGQ